MAAVGRLAASASRGSAPPPEPGLLESLCRDRERRASVAIDQLSFVASPNGFLTAARAATALEAVAADAAAALAPPNGGQDGMATSTAGKKGVNVVAAVRPAAPLLLRPLVSTSVQAKIGEFRSLLSLESRPLTSLSVTGLAFEASRSEWWDLDEITAAIFHNTEDPQTAANVDLERRMPNVGWSGWAWTGGRHRTALGYLRVSLQGLELLDLTTDGQLHNQVISHEGAPDEAAASPSAMHGAVRGTSTTDRRASGSKGSRAHEAPPKDAAAVQRLPVIVVELIPENSRRSGGREINASVRGLRVCFLHRFVAEVLKYFGPDRLGPVFAVVRRFGRGNGDRDVADSEAEDESVAVVLGEEDQVVPDKWSTAGSEDGRGSNSRRTAYAPSAGARGEKYLAKAEVAPGSGEAGAGMRVIAVLQDLTVVIPRNTHSREAAAVKCKELVLEVSCEEPAWSLSPHVYAMYSVRHTQIAGFCPGPPRPPIAETPSPPVDALNVQFRRLAPLFESVSSVSEAAYRTLVSYLVCLYLARQKTRSTLSTVFRED